MSLLDGVTDERAKELVTELSMNQLMGLLFLKAAVERQRVDIRVRPLEARARTGKKKRASGG